MIKYTIDDFQDALIYEGTIEGEIAPPPVPPCFPGAWYRKVVSSKDKWLGIEAIVELPQFFPDPNRLEPFDREAHFPFKDEYLRPLDSPSVYLGGFGGYETDIGFGYNRGYLDPNCTVISKEKITFRPFWRYIYPDETGVVRNIYTLDPFTNLHHYYYPGDVVRVKVFCPEKDKMQLMIELIEPTKIEKYKLIRENHQLGDKMFTPFISPLIPSPGQGTNLAEYKRVNAIDQFYNEGKKAKFTESYTTATIWKEVYLFRNIDGNLKRVPFNQNRFTSMQCPIAEAIKVSYDNVNENLGGERSQIDPRGKVF